jgi:hypothetical protein
VTTTRLPAPSRSTAILPASVTPPRRASQRIEQAFETNACTRCVTASP